MLTAFLLLLGGFVALLGTVFMLSYNLGKMERRNKALRAKVQDYQSSVDANFREMVASWSVSAEFKEIAYKALLLKNTSLDQLQNSYDKAVKSLTEKMELYGYSPESFND